jgi:hypothetical protein
MKKEVPTKEQTSRSMSTTERTAIDQEPSCKLNRRSFLKLGGIGTTLAAAPASVAAEISPPPHGGRAAESHPSELPSIPKPADLASDTLVHHFRDYFNPPQATNEFGFLQAHKSVSAMQAITFAPFTCCGLPDPPNSRNLITCELFLNGQILGNYPAPAGEVAYKWYPHKIWRQTRVEGLLFTTETFMPAKHRVVAQQMVVKNESGEHRKGALGLDLRAGIARMTHKNNWWYRYAELDNRLTADERRGCVVFESQHGQAVSVQGISPPPNRMEQRRMLVHQFSLAPGESRTFHYVNAIAESAEAALAIYDRLQGRFDEAVKEHESGFTGLLRSAFTPGNSEFSGYLPELHTHNPLLWKLYYNGLAGMLFCRRDSPASVYGPTYITCVYGASTSWIWDTMLTSLSMALLDPDILRMLLEVWLSQDMHQYVATDFMTGHGVGSWGYAVNDYGILRCAHAYLRVTGDFAWLDKDVDGKPVMARLLDHALYWKTLVKRPGGLADYGDMRNLLEVVSTWVHEVAGINAGNVYGMRFVATLLERRGDSRQAAQLRSEAKELAAQINRLLYVEGKGWWKCGQPDGTYKEVRHCYDLLAVFDAMFEDLSDRQKKEMSNFFWTELHTPLWMHALSPYDDDATWDVRADHSWLGAYVAWPPMTAKGLYKIDPSARVAEWVKGLARSGNQGPYAQAHVVESVFPPEKGGAMKSPYDLPYQNDWAIVAGGSFTDMVIDSIFGADLTLYDGIGMKSRLSDFDPEAKLSNLNYQGKKYTVTHHDIVLTK